MKTIVLFLFSFGAFASSDSLREVCENAHYATDYVLLHQYDVTVDWSRLSDHGHLEMESVIFGDYFSVINERDLSNGKSIFSIKEVPGSDSFVYELGLEILQRLTFQGVACRWAKPAR